MADNGITHRVLPVAVHASAVERLIASVREKLRAATAGRMEGWLKEVSAVEHAINSSPSASDGRSPFERYLGYRPRVPLLQQDQAASTELKEVAARSAQQLVEIIDRFHEQREVVAELHDHGRVTSKVAVGDWVCISHKFYRPSAEVGSDKKFAKLKYQFSEPYQVLADEGNGNWRINIPEGTRVSPVFHQSALKPTSIINSDVDDD